MKSPNIYIIAGPNGSGKTTFAKEYLPRIVKCPNFVNADLIAQKISPFSPEKVAIKAGRILLEKIRKLAEEKADFAFETTLSGRAYFSLLKEFKQEGYLLHLFYLWVPSVQLSLERIKARVAEGGHNIPEEDVRRRFGKSLSNLFNIYRPLLDRWVLFDNSTADPYLIATEENGKLIIENNDLFEKILKLAGQ